jgi:hypothetical protein
MLLFDHGKGEFPDMWHVRRISECMVIEFFFLSAIIILHLQNKHDLFLYAQFQVKPNIFFFPYIFG